MSKVFCFGEILLRLSPAANGGWTNALTIPTFIGGAEANVANALANWKVPVKYSTAMPDNFMGHDVADYLARRGIDMSAMHYSGNRIGTYYMAQGADLKHAGVIYDRAYSSFAELKPGMMNWDEALEDVSWFHFTAISPALNEDAVAVCKEALEAAAAKGIFISIDLNFRAKLWKYGKKPVEVIPELAQYCDLIMGNIWAANNLLGISVDADIEAKNNKADYVAHAAKTANAIREAFPNCKTVANTFRFDHNDGGINYYCTFHPESGDYTSVEFLEEKIIDKAGSGDCFMAGLIYGITNQYQPQHIIDFAAAAAFGKLHEVGDATMQTVEDVKKILSNHE